MGNHEFSEGQKLSLFLAAHVDGAFTIVERATAAKEMEALQERKQPVPGLLVGQVLTALGREAVRDMLPEPSYDLWPFVVADVMRRVRARSRGMLLCADIRAVACDVAGRAGWRISWECDGWTAFSRQSDDPEAARNRAELEGAAAALGLEVVAEAAPTMLVAPPVEEIVIPFEAVEAMARKEAAERMTTLDNLILLCDQEDREARERMVQWRTERRAFLAACGVKRAEDLDDANFAIYCAGIQINE